MRSTNISLSVHRTKSQYWTSQRNIWHCTCVKYACDVVSETFVHQCGEGSLEVIRPLQLSFVSHWKNIPLPSILCGNRCTDTGHLVKLPCTDILDLKSYLTFSLWSQHGFQPAFSHSRSLQCPHGQSHIALPVSVCRWCSGCAHQQWETEQVDLALCGKPGGA